jgi:5-methylcytosine-specific restriction endonuclease McrA
LYNKGCRCDRCREAKSEYDKASYQKRRNKRLADGKRYRDENPDRMRELKRKWATENPEKNRARSRRYIEKNRATIRKRQRQRHDAEINAQRCREWRAVNAEKTRLYVATRRARKRNNPDSVGISERDWLRLVRRYRGCAYCGAITINVELDHVVPLSKGGRHAIGNVLPACKSCNSRKNSRLLADWRFRP